MKDEKLGNPLARHGGLSYLLIPAVRPEESSTFYAAVLGWDIDQRSADDYRFTDGQGMLIGRWVRAEAVARANAPVPYYYVSSLDRALALVAERGCELVEPVKAEGDIRRASVRDPAGNTIGLWQFGA